MRFHFLLLFLLPLGAATVAQETKPEIIGQKDLYTDQGKPITLQLSDLVVREIQIEDSGGNNPPGDSDEPDDEDPGHGQNDDDDVGGDSKGDPDHKGDKDDKKDKDNKHDKDHQKDKDNKKNKGNGHGGGRLTYPDGYVLDIFTGKDYTFSGTTVIPDEAFTGVLSVWVRVRNAKHASPKYELKITVRPALPPDTNKPPVITGQSRLSTPMDTPLQLKFSDLQVSDPDDLYPEGFSITLVQADHFEVKQNTIHPQKGFTGMLAVPVVVNDGKADSEPFTLSVDVTQIVIENIAPTIIGQISLSVSANQSVDILLTHLVVQDPDNDFPDDFALKVYGGDNYSVDQNSIKPADDFTGDLRVKVTVNDGTSESPVFLLVITVTPSANRKPVITGQTGIKIPEGERVTIELSHLVVDDSDNRYPDDFTLQVSPGENYALAGNTVTPDAGFLGTLRIPVTVDDGKDVSDPFPIIVQVIARDRLDIVGQKAVEVAEDSSVLITTSHLVVNDPSGTYPQGFTINVQQGQNYEVVNNAIKPVKDFFGNITANVTVNRGGTVSDPFSLLIVVKPVNDPPEIVNLQTEPLLITSAGPWAPFAGAELVDADDSHLLFAEISLDAHSYNAMFDRLQAEPADSLHVVFDDKKGVLFVLGRASLATYQKLVESVTYTYAANADTMKSIEPKTIHITLNDGKQTSIDYTRTLTFEGDVPLEIPSAFTPNNDNANDTWKIVPMRNVERLSGFIRVYDRRGNMVFEANDLTNEWDGQFGGSPLPSDVYFYTIELNLSYKKANYKGIVSILR